MSKKYWRWKKGTLRIYLTGWYVMWLSCTLLLFSSYLYFTLKHSLIRQLDQSLEITASETLPIITRKNEKLKFQPTSIPKNTTVNQHLKKADLIVYLLTNKGEIFDSLGNKKIIDQPITLKEGYTTQKYENKNWRFYNQPITISHIDGWLQVGESLQIVDESISHLLTLILLSFPLIVVTVSFGGLFLANRALSPIDHIIKTVEMISVDDFTKRINYSRTFNEMSRLALKIDQMLDRIQSAFNHERRFTADVSHELRTPLTIMKGKIEVTLSRERNLKDYSTILQDVETQVNHLIRLINSLLFLSKLEQEENEQYFDQAEIDLSNLLDILSEQLQILGENRQIKFYKQIDPNLMILGNSDYLTSLFFNLLDNAFKYTPNQGKVSLVVVQKLPYVIISILNTGEGIEAEHLPFVFDRFYRTETARSRQTGGTGLGLAIAKEIAILHGGFIEVSSTLHEKTNFSVYLPIIKIGNDH